MLAVAVLRDRRFTLAIDRNSYYLQRVPTCDLALEGNLIMHTPEEIEENKARASKGWIAEPPPKIKEPSPEAHRNKWRLMNLNKRA